jgi:hypothetical protein
MDTIPKKTMLTETGAALDASKIRLEVNTEEIK